MSSKKKREEKYWILRNLLCFNPLYQRPYKKNELLQKTGCSRWLLNKWIAKATNYGLVERLSNGSFVLSKPGQRGMQCLLRAEILLRQGFGEEEAVKDFQDFMDKPFKHQAARENAKIF